MNEEVRKKEKISIIYLLIMIGLAIVTMLLGAFSSPPKIMISELDSVGRVLFSATIVFFIRWLVAIIDCYTEHRKQKRRKKNEKK
ncbi:hypothetical protein ACFL29_02200 [Patescibacteria group bacterium]